MLHFVNKNSNRDKIGLILSHLGKDKPWLQDCEEQLMWCQSFWGNCRFNSVYWCRHTWYLSTIQFFNDGIFPFYNITAGLNWLAAGD